MISQGTDGMISHAGGGSSCQPQKALLTGIQCKNSSPIAFVRFGMLSHVGTLPGSGLGEGTSWKFFIHLVGSREAMMISVADI